MYVCLWHLFHNVPVIVSSWNCQELLPLTKVISMQEIKVRCQRSRSQMSKQILTQFWCCQTLTEVWIYRWLGNDTQSLQWHRRFTLLFLKVICQISRSHGTKDNWFDPYGVSGLQLELEFTDGYEMMHKAWSSIEVPYCSLKLSIKFQGHTGQKNTYIEPNWAFPGRSSSFNSLMTLKGCIKHDVA